MKAWCVMLLLFPLLLLAKGNNYIGVGGTLTNVLVYGSMLKAEFDYEDKSQDDTDLFSTEKGYYAKYGHIFSDRLAFEFAYHKKSFDLGVSFIGDIPDLESYTANAYEAGFLFGSFKKPASAYFKLSAMYLELEPTIQTNSNNFRFSKKTYNALDVLLGMGLMLNFNKHLFADFGMSLRFPINQEKMQLVDASGTHAANYERLWTSELFLSMGFRF